MIRMVDRLRIQTLCEAGLTVHEVAEQVGVGSRSVERICSEPAITDLDGGPTPMSRNVGRPSKVVGLVDDEKVESLVRALLAGFEAFGGIPLRSVFDNPKTIVVRRDGERVEWNPTFGQMAVDYGLGIELCAPRRPRQKGSVENLVGIEEFDFTFQTSVRLSLLGSYVGPELVTEARSLILAGVEFRYGRSRRKRKRTTTSCKKQI